MTVTPAKHKRATDPIQAQWDAFIRTNGRAAAASICNCLYPQVTFTKTTTLQRRRAVSTTLILTQTVVPTITSTEIGSQGTITETSTISITEQSTPLTTQTTTSILSVTTTTTTSVACSTDLLTDPDNCGSCGNVCQSGVCSRGTCSCAPRQCSTFVQGGCSDSGSLCYCLLGTQGTALCASLVGSCSSFTRCTTDANCSNGSICALSTCCGYGLCISEGNCGNPRSVKRMFGRERRGIWSDVLGMEVEA